MDSKPFWQSKVLWANLIGVGIAIVEGTYGVTGIPAAYLTYIVLAMNLVLRFLTNQALAGK